MKPSVFIGSSAERLDIAEAIEVNLEGFAEVTSWKHLFKPGRPFLNDLSDIKDKVDFAIIVLTPDDAVISRNVSILAPRDNVVFELGLFIGSLGHDRVFAVCDNTSDSKILSDYLGVTYLTYEGSRNDRDLHKALSPVCIRIKQRIRDLGCNTSRSKSRMGSTEQSLMGLEKIYPTYMIAEKDILNDLKGSAGPIRLFLQIASQNIGLKGSLFDILNDLSSKSIEIRILHTSEASPLFSRERLLSLGKTPDQIIATLRYVNDSLRDLESKPGTSLRHRIHNWPFLWRIYAFEKRLYLMPYFSEKNATSTSPVLVFSKRDNSFYNTFVNWFDFAWEQCSPKAIRISDLITPATPAGTALFIEWEGFHVFGIPKRDLYIDSDYLRFYGVGGKRRDGEESWEHCAMREGNEETGHVVREVLSAHHTHFFRANGTIEQIKVVNEEKVPRMILEKTNHSGYGSMPRSADHYYVVAFDAVVSRKPKASGEVAALVFLNSHHLSLIKRRTDITIGDLLDHGALLDRQEGVEINHNRILVPHGTAAYLMRQIPE